MLRAFICICCFYDYADLTGEKKGLREVYLLKITHLEDQSWTWTLVYLESLLRITAPTIFSVTFSELNKEKVKDPKVAVTWEAALLLHGSYY